MWLPFPELFPLLLLLLAFLRSRLSPHTLNAPDAFGRPRSTCSNYDFTLQTTATGLEADLNYPDATGSVTKLYGDGPTFASAEYHAASTNGLKAWPSVLDDPTNPGDGLTPGVGSTPTPF